MRATTSHAHLRAAALTAVDRAFGIQAKIVGKRAQEETEQRIGFYVTGFGRRYEISIEREARVRRIAREAIDRAFNANGEVSRG